MFTHTFVKPHVGKRATEKYPILKTIVDKLLGEIESNIVDDIDRKGDPSGNYYAEYYHGDLAVTYDCGEVEILHNEDCRRTSPLVEKEIAKRIEGEISYLERKVKDDIAAERDMDSHIAYLWSCR